MSLYTPQILSLAAELANFPLTAAFAHRASARSRTCGSVIEIGVESDADGLITRVGVQITACAMGQASAAILAQGLGGRTSDDVAAAHAGLAAWLTGEGGLPNWPQLDLIVPALPHKGRHGALLLPWTAAGKALCAEAASG